MNNPNTIDVTFRLIAPEDAEQLHANCMPRGTVESIRRWIPEYLRAHEAGEKVPLVAVTDGEVRGTATLVRDPHPLRRHVGDITQVVVDYRYWRRGIARGLFGELTAHATAMGIELLATSCRGGTTAETVYRRLGFVEYGRLPRGLKEASGRVFDEVFLYQSLLPVGGSAAGAGGSRRHSISIVRPPPG
jgi:GNAT superfamily N-acetyltransferase